MDIDIINTLLNDSTWSNTDNNYVYRFANGKEVYINNSTCCNYVLNYDKNRIVILMGVAQKYYVNYINDFTLELFNTKEKFRIMPESA
jgi:hypothetical protein